MKAGWKSAILGEVCTLQRGFDLPTQQRTSGDFPLVSSSGIIDSHCEGPVKGPGVVTGRSGSIGNVFFVESNFWPLNTTLYVRDFHGNDPRYIYYLLNKFDLKRFAGGTGVPTLNRNDVHCEAVYISRDIGEQKRIVSILDEAFEGIATAKANASQNAKNAQEIFRSNLNGLFARKGKGWSEETLSDLAVFRNGINFTKSSKGTPIKILGVKDFQNHLWAPLDDLESIMPDGIVPDQDLLAENDILFVRSNGNPELIGRSVLVGKLHEKTTHSGFTIKARLNTNAISPLFLAYFLKSSVIRKELVDGGNGANIKSLNQGALGRLILPFPKLSEQAKLVKEFEELQSETQSLAAIYRQKIAALDELKKSLLHQAFSGTL